MPQLGKNISTGRGKLLIPPREHFFEKSIPFPPTKKMRVKLGSVLKKINPRKTNHVFEKLKVVLNDIDRYFDAQNFKYHKMQ